MKRYLSPKMKGYSADIIYMLDMPINYWQINTLKIDKRKGQFALLIIGDLNDKNGLPLINTKDSFRSNKKVLLRNTPW